MISLKIDGEDISYEKFTFPGGEQHVRLLSGCIILRGHIHGIAFIDARMRSSSDIIDLLLLTDALRRAQVQEIHLLMPYLPYARQDRVCVPGEALSIKVMCDLINAQNFDSVEVWDVHSDVALALLQRVKHVPCHKFVHHIGVSSANTVLVSPDAGSLKKVIQVGHELNVPFCVGTKERNPWNGEINGVSVGSNHVGNKNFLIVDDICDGGRTFIELAKKLRPLTNGKIFLYVTHGIFSAGTNVFDGLIDEIYVANSFVEQLPSNFRLISR